MFISVFDLFKIGLGPSSSHTMGPMRAARAFVASFDTPTRNRITRIHVDLYGSLAATGIGHGTDRAVLLGLAGHRPDDVTPGQAGATVDEIRRNGAVAIDDSTMIAIDTDRDLTFHRSQTLPGHPNALRFTAYDATSAAVASRVYFSIGGGFIRTDDETDEPAVSGDTPAAPHPFTTADELLTACQASDDRPISALARENERTRRPDEEIDRRLDRIWQVMAASIERGCTATGALPGPLAVTRRAPGLRAKLDHDGIDRLDAVDWASMFAIAVNEENAAGGQVVTAPTNGAAGIIPAVGSYWLRFGTKPTEQSAAGDVRRFLLTAGAIGSICKQTASISGAEVGCQGEIGVAAAMAAGGLAELMGGTPRQVENAAEIALEHHLGMTCDPVGGLVQVPCIERNAMGAVKAINAARLALHGDGKHVVSLDQAIEAMRATGADMQDKYKETALGGLAAVTGLTVGLPDC